MRKLWTMIKGWKMSKNFLFNSRFRDSLEDEISTPKFKTVYPDFATFKHAIETFNMNSLITATEIKEKHYNLLQIMIGNANLRYSTDVKNYGYLSSVFQSEWFKLKRRKQLNDIGLSELLNERNTSTQTLYTIDRTLTGDADPKYIDNKVVNEIKQAKSPIDYYDKLKEYTQVEDPELVFVMNIAYNIVFPFQQAQQRNGGIF